jgi:hypothetical protein
VEVVVAAARVRAVAGVAARVSAVAAAVKAAYVFVPNAAKKHLTSGASPAPPSNVPNAGQ